jgi:hypothetical protein
VPGFTHDYTIHLTIGTAGEIRHRFAGLRPNPETDGK